MNRKLVCIINLQLNASGCEQNFNQDNFSCFFKFFHKSSRLCRGIGLWWFSVFAEF